MKDGKGSPDLQRLVGAQRWDLAQLGREMAGSGTPEKVF